MERKLFNEIKVVFKNLEKNAPEVSSKLGVDIELDDEDVYLLGSKAKIKNACHLIQTASRLITAGCALTPENFEDSFLK